MPAASLKHEMEQMAKEFQQTQEEIRILENMIQAANDKTDSEQRLINLVLQKQDESVRQIQKILETQENLSERQNDFDKKQIQLHKLLSESMLRIQMLLEIQENLSERQNNFDKKQISSA